jgi:hypothetical protein
MNYKPLTLGIHVVLLLVLELLMWSMMSCTKPYAMAFYFAGLLSGYSGALLSVLHGGIEESPLDSVC